MAYNITSPTAPKPISDFYKPITSSTGTAASGGSSGGGYYDDSKPKKAIPSPINTSNITPQRNQVTYVNGRPAFVNGNPIGQFQNMNLSEANGHIYSTTNTDVNAANINQQNISSGINGEHNAYANLDPQAQTNVRLATQALDSLENKPLSENFDIDTRQEGSFLSVTENPDGTYHIRTSGIRWGNDTYGSFDLGNLSYNPQTAYDVTMPLLNYAANYEGYDSTNQIVQGAMSLGRSMSAISPQFASIYDGGYVSDFLNATDMAYNWNSRNDMENAIAGINTATGVMSKLELGGASDAARTVQNGLALYNFGNSFYHLVNNWDDMTTQQRIGGLIGTTWAGTMAYTPAADLVSNISSWSSSMGSSAASAGAAGASAGAGAAGAELASKFATINTMNASGQALNNAANSFAAEIGESTSETLSKITAEGATNVTTEEAANVTAEASGDALKQYIGNAAAYAAFAYCLYDLATNSKAYGPQEGHARASVGTGAKYSALTVATAAAAEAAGLFSVSGIGAAIAAVVAFAVGYGVGMVKTGHSAEQGRRTMYEKALINTGVFNNRNGSYVMQLADGQFYTLLDGSGKRATDISGNKKTVYDESKIKNRNNDFVNRRDESGNIKAYLQPYDIDYTCDLDFTSSIMGKGLLALSLGSNYKGSGEMDQMLGYIVNGVTSNTGRDWSKENFTNVVANLRAAYYRSGIGSKEDGVRALIDAYFSGAITESDYRQSLMGLDFVYDDNGFEQATQLMTSMGRGGNNSTSVTEAIEDKQQEIADNGARLAQESQAMNQMSEEPQMIPEQSNQLDEIDLSLVTPSENAAQGATLDVPAETSVEATTPVEPTTAAPSPMVPDVAEQYQQTASAEAPQEPVTETQS